jgi:ribosomal-protein-alanine N-acetyltransferase
MKTLETERLVLRPFRLEDREEIHRLVYADPQVAPVWSSRTWTLAEITESFAHKLAQRPNGLDFQAITLKATGELIGLLGFQLYEEGDIEEYMIFEQEASRRTYDPGFFEVEITYALGYAFWHQGYATEAGKALIEHGFRELTIGRIVNSVAAENIPSVKLMKRLGLRIQRDLKPTPFTGPWKNSPGMIGILVNPHWQRA